jgi:uncharacterized repeat protein (TIGR02543 family)
LDSSYWYEVTFDTDGGSAAPDAQNILNGGLVTEPSAPTKYTYTFVGWSIDGTTIWDFATDMVSENTVLTAMWALDPTYWFEVSFDTDGGSAAPDAQHILTGNMATEPPAPTKATYLFVGWSVDREMIWDFGTDTVYENITLTAMWALDPTYWFEVTFDTDGGSAAPDVQHILNGGLATEPSAPTKDTYLFVGWSVDGETIWDFGADTVSGDMTLTAMWALDGSVMIEVTYDSSKGSVTYTVNDGKNPTYSGTYTGTLMVLGGAQVTLTAAAKDGYGFSAWSGDMATNGISVTFNAYADMDIIAVFIGSGISGNDGTATIQVDHDATKGSIMYAINDGVNPEYSGTYTGKLTVAIGAQVTLTAVAEDGHEFFSWTGDLAGNDPVATLDVDGDKTVGAIFYSSTEDVYTLTMTVQGNGTGTVMWSVDGRAWAELIRHDGTIEGNSAVLIIPKSLGYIMLREAADDDMLFYSWYGALAGNAEEQMLTFDQAADTCMTGAIFHIHDDPDLYSSAIGEGKIQWSVDGETWADLPDDLTVPVGETIYLKAVPDEGMKFLSWSGDLEGSQNPMSLLVDSGISIGAVFGEDTKGSIKGHLWLILPLMIMMAIFGILWLMMAKDRKEEEEE